MARKFVARKLPTLMFISLISGSVIYFFYGIMKSAEKNLVDYKLAISCPSEDNCREKIEATVLESQAKKIDATSKGHRYENTTYLLLVSSEIGKRWIEIPANPPSVGTPFDIGNVNIPPATGSKFIKENNLNWNVIYIESWRGHIIFVYIDKIIDLPEQSTSTTGHQEVQASINPSPQKTYEIAMPTSEHPILVHAMAVYNFRWATFFCVLVIFISFVIVIMRK